MITIQLDNHSAENMRGIQALRKLGMSDEEIQQYVDRQSEIDKGEKNETNN